MSTVYLAGPITGCTYGGCTNWRNYAKQKLAEVGIVGLDPMRAKEYLANETSVGNNYDHPISCPRGIMTRDHWDCIRCDVLLVNLKDADKVSIGTVMEIAWAWDNDIPIICVMNDGNPHDHAMIKEAIGFRAYCLDEAIAIAKAILCP
ncbi:MAG: nucleoside 2-deoxyribosyltransferase [Candidatus Omnitrophota bacterium]|jgi:nucleoside 2-deoxyribosyltransferase